MRFEKILVTTDFSEESLAAVEFASYQAKMEGSEVHIVTIVADTFVPVGLFDYIPNPSELETQRDAVIQAAKKRLSVIAKEKFHEQRISTEVLVSLKPAAQEIADHAQKLGVNLIVMGSRGAGALGAFVLGSVVQKTIQLSSVPVLVIPKGART